MHTLKNARQRCIRTTSSSDCTSAVSCGPLALPAVEEEEDNDADEAKVTEEFKYCMQVRTNSSRCC